VVVVIVVLVGGLAAFVIGREGNLAWDDADYLRRALHITGTAASAGESGLSRAIHLTLTEHPKPPLLIAWIELGTSLLGRRNLLPLILFSSVLPFAILVVTTAAIATRLFGPRTAVVAVLCVAASPMALSFGAKVMVESFMALWVCVAFYFAAILVEQRTRLRAFGLGIGIAGGLMTKLTVALLLPGPAIVFCILYYRRHRLDRFTIRLFLWVLMPVLAFAAPWYVRNGRDAIEFARFSAHYDITALGRADGTPKLERLWLLGDRLAGWPLLALAGVAVTVAVVDRRGRIERRQSASAGHDFAVLSVTGAVSGALILLGPSYFDPRFLAPIWPPLAVCLVSELWKLHARRPRVATAATSVALVAGLMLSTHRLRDEPRTVTYWQTRRLIDELVTRHGASVIANLGDSRDWNVCKTGLINELRDNPGDCFVLHDLSRKAPDEIARRLRLLDAVVVLDRSALPPGFLEESPGLNRAYAAVEPVLDQNCQFQKIEPRITAGLPPLSIYVRRR
jgi:4-amino-4-deoxy-L-arabinose transferase-like glycosyltransferase